MARNQGSDIFFKMASIAVPTATATMDKATTNVTIKSRAGHLGFAVLRCSLKSCFQANLNIKISYFRTGLFK